MKLRTVVTPVSPGLAPQRLKVSGPSFTLSTTMPLTIDYSAKMLKRASPKSITKQAIPHFYLFLNAMNDMIIND